MINDELENYISNIHGKSRGYITKACIRNNVYFQRHYKFGNLIKLDFDGENVYLSSNTFFKPYRKTETLKELNAIWIDIDFYNTPFEKSQVILNLEDNFYKKLIPEPSYCIESGRGLYLIWLIKPVPYKALPLWRAIEENFYQKLKELGADKKCLDCTRVLRVPGSINSKSKTKVKILFQTNLVYTLREIQAQYLPEYNKSKVKKGHKSKVITLFNERTLYLARIHDLVKLCELRNYDLVGHREFILFLYRYYICFFTDDTDKALEDTLDLNSKFIHKLKVKEVINATKSAQSVYEKNKKYKYKNETLIDELSITDEEQKYLKTIISKAEFQRRKKLRNQQYYQQNKDHINQKAKEKYKKVQSSICITDQHKKIKDLLDEGLSLDKISDILNTSLRTVKRRIKEIKSIISDI